MLNHNGEKTAKKKNPVLQATLSSPIWLLSDWSASIWLLEADNDIPRKVDGEWKGVVTINFARLLPNGKYLTDPKYQELLEDIKRIIYYCREGLFGHAISRSKSQRRLAHDLISLVCFMVNEGLDKPSTLLLFSSLTISHFEKFCRLAASGGLAAIEGHEKRIHEYITNIADKNIRKLDNPFNTLSARQIAKATHIKLESVKAYLSRNLSRYDDCELSIDTDIVVSAPRREHLSNREVLPSKTDLRPKEPRVATLISIWSYVYKYGEFLNHRLLFDPFQHHSSPTAIAQHLLAPPKGRTPTIPVDTAMYILDAAIKWVTVYGYDLVNYKNDLDAELRQLMSKGTARQDYYVKQAFDNVPIPESLTELNFQRANRHQTGTGITKRRSELAVNDAIECLIAASFILFATFTAIRKDGVLKLNSDSVIKGPDGWDVRFGIQKASATSRLDQIERPIPDLLEHVSFLLSNLFPIQRSDCPDAILANRLFVYLAHQNHLADIENALLRILDLFADIIELPQNHEDARWYIRPHECRRLFAIFYFRHQKYHQLDALTWFMGHLDPSETRRYITEAHGSMEFDEEERRFILDAIRNGIDEAELKPLTKHIQSHFNESNIDNIDSELLEEYIQRLIESDCLDIRIHTFSIEKNASPFLVQFLEP